MLKLTYCLVAGVLSTSLFPALAVARDTCRVSYEQKYGFSSPVQTEVTFLSGYELNNKVGGYNYKSYKLYAIIFFSNNEAAILESRTSVIMGLEVSLSDYKNFKTFIKYFDQVNGEYDREWQINCWY